MSSKLENSLNYLKENYNDLFISNIKKRRTGDTVSDDTVNTSLMTINNNNDNKVIVNFNGEEKALSIKEYIDEKKKDISSLTSQAVVLDLEEELNDLVEKYSDVPVPLIETFDMQKGIVKNIKLLQTIISDNRKMSSNYNNEREISSTLKRLGNYGININTLTDLSNKLVSKEYNRFNYKDSLEYKQIMSQVKTDEQEEELEKYIDKIVRENTGIARANNIIKELDNRRLIETFIDEETKDISKSIVQKYEIACDTKSQEDIDNLMKELNSINYVDAIIGSDECVCPVCNQYVNVKSSWYEIILPSISNGPILVPRMHICPKCGSKLSLKPLVLDLLKILINSSDANYTPYIDSRLGLCTKYTIISDILVTNLPKIFYDSYSQYCILNNKEPQAQLSEGNSVSNTNYEMSDFDRIISEYKEFVSSINDISRISKYERKLEDEKILNIIENEELSEKYLNKFRIKESKDKLENQLAKLFTIEDNPVIDKQMKIKINKYVDDVISSFSSLSEVKEFSNNENMYLTAYNYSKIRDIDTSLPRFITSLIKSSKTVKANIKLLCKLVGVDYNSIKSSSVYSLRKALNESELYNYTSYDSSIKNLLKEIRYLKSLIGKLSNYNPLLDELEYIVSIVNNNYNTDYYLDTANLPINVAIEKVEDLIEDLLKPSKKNKYLYNSILLYAFSEINFSKETNIENISDWEDLVSDLMILVYISDYIEESYEIPYSIVDRVGNFEKLDEVIVGNVKPINKESILRLDNAFNLYKSIKYKSYRNYRDTLKSIKTDSSLGLSNSKFLVGSSTIREPIGFDFYRELLDEIVNKRTEKVDEIRENLIKNSVQFEYPSGKIRDNVSSLSTNLDIKYNVNGGVIDIILDGIHYNISNKGIITSDLEKDETLPTLVELLSSNTLVVPNYICNYRLLYSLTKSLSSNIDGTKIIDTDEPYKVAVDNIKMIPSDKEDYLVDEIPQSIEVAISYLGFSSREDYFEVLRLVNIDKSASTYIINNIRRISSEKELNKIINKSKEFTSLVKKQEDILLSKLSEMSSKPSIQELEDFHNTAHNLYDLRMEKLKLLGLNYIYVVDLENLMYDFENNEDFLIIKGMHTIYSRVQNSKVNLSGIVSVLKNSMYGNILDNESIPKELRVKYLKDSSEYICNDLESLEDFLSFSNLINDTDDEDSFKLDKFINDYREGYIGRTELFNKFCNEDLESFKDLVGCTIICNNNILEEFINKYRGGNKNSKNSLDKIKIYINDYLGEKNIVKSIDKSNRKAYVKLIQKINNEIKSNNGYLNSDSDEILKELEGFLY